MHRSFSGGRKYLSGGYWDQPFSKPYFENSTKREVTTTVGQVAYLHCRVRNLGDRAVSWIRKRDLHILTVGILTYTISQAEILGNPELHLKSGSDINLTCIVRQTPEPPTYIYWYHGRRVINYSQRGGINVVTEKQTRTSRLLISKAQPSDSGNYTCSPSNSESASVLVHVLNEEL
ncbi:Titin [Orchesella cincta]|uniref:Titin n=1 Tax=Orchesella cincta TaxID=48709 RepID=A0A1D2N8A8_ORCCI|nr:Titin [Orchesella cincta]